MDKHRNHRSCALMCSSSARDTSVCRKSDTHRDRDRLQWPLFSVGHTVEGAGGRGSSGDCRCPNRRTCCWCHLSLCWTKPLATWRFSRYRAAMIEGITMVMQNYGAKRAAPISWLEHSRARRRALAVGWPEGTANFHVAKSDGCSLLPINATNHLERWARLGSFHANLWPAQQRGVCRSSP